MFAPEPQRRSEDQAAAGSRRVLRNEQKVEYNLKIQGVLYYFSPFSFSLFCSAWLLSASKKKKKKIKAIYKLILLAHKVLLSSGAWRERESRSVGEKKDEERAHWHESQVY